MSLPAVDGRMSRGDCVGTANDGWPADEAGDDGVFAPLAHPARAPTSRTSAARRTLLITPATLPRPVRFHADIVRSELPASNLAEHQLGPVAVVEADDHARDLRRPAEDRPGTVLGGPAVRRHH